MPQRWNLTNSGHLCSRKAIKPGYGLPYVERHARLWHVSLVIGVKRHAANYGVLFPNHIALEPVIVISGRHTPLSFPKITMKRLAKKQAKQRMWSAGTIRFASD